MSLKLYLIISISLYISGTLSLILTRTYYPARTHDNFHSLEVVDRVNFHSLEVVDRVSETQLQVGENLHT